MTVEMQERPVTELNGPAAPLAAMPVVADAIPLMVEPEVLDSPRRVESGRAERVAAAVLVPLSVLLVGLRLAGMMPHAVHATGAILIGTFFLVYPAYRLARKVVLWCRRVRTPAASWDATPAPRWVVWNWAWSLSLLWLMTIPLLGFT